MKVLIKVCKTPGCDIGDSMGLIFEDSDSSE